MLFRHKKTGGVYRLEMLTTNEADLTTRAVYSDARTGTIWDRPASEFFDGRYERVIADPDAEAEADLLRRLV